MFGFGLTAAAPRTDHRRELEPGSTLFLYTDGLVESRKRDIDTGIDALLGLLATLHDRPSRDIVDVTVAELATDAPDDVVAFAIRFPPAAARATERR